MKINVNYVYWLLLFISIVSSSLLFLIVASETIVTPSETASIGLHEEINNTDSGVNSNHRETSQEAVNELVTEQKAVSKINAEIHSSFEEAITSQENSNNRVPVLTNIVSQNSGFVEKFSDTGQIILTLVDTTTIDLGEDINIDKKNLQTVSPENVDIIPHNSSQIPLVPIKHSTSNLSENLVTKLKQLHVFEASQNIHDTNSTNLENDLLDEESSEEETDKTVEAVIDYLSNVSEIPGIKETAEFQKPTVVDDGLIPNEVSKQVPGEDIPSFSEWAQRQLEEAEKKKEVSNTSIQNQQGSLKSNSNLKLRSTNYASPDCGAKIIATNPESTMPGAVLSPSRDEYMLNTCTSRIWFVVELCEAIQAKKIELANFELFSSSPKNFSVHVSDRFPTRDWSIVGHFTANDERDIQNFTLDSNIFGKYVKVELHSHYGSEHFCPISLFRIYGTSEIEVLDTEDQVNLVEYPDDDEDDGFDDTSNSDKEQIPSNLFGSARDAVMSLVKKAAQVLVIKSDSSNHTGQRTVDCSLTKLPITDKCQTPSHVIVCNNCSDIFFGNVYGLLSCRNNILINLSELSYISKVLLESDTCVEYGLNLNSKQTSSQSQLTSRAVFSFLGPEYIAALCNIRAIKEKKVLLNTSNSLYTNFTSNVFVDFNVNTLISDSLELVPKVEKDIEFKQSSSDVLIESEKESDVITSSVISESTVEKPPVIEIYPTKTFKEDDVHEDTLIGSISVMESSIESLDTGTFVQSSIHIPSSTKASEDDLSETSEVKKSSIKDKPSILSDKEYLKEIPVENRTTANLDNQTESTEAFDLGPEQLDTLFPEFEQDQNTNSVVTTTVPPPSSILKQQGQKESVFIRLYNRIKALERNMSLSSQYLEELSRRYKKQMEEMQRAFEKTLAAVTEENLRSEEFQKQSSEEFNRIQIQLQTLASAVEVLMSERNSWSHVASWFMHFFISQLCVAAIILYFCGKSENKPYDELNNEGENKITVPTRRKSVDVVGHETPTANRRRRPSEEALNICGTYEDLLIPDITDIDSGLMYISKSKRKRRKNSILRKTNSSNNLSVVNLQDSEVSNIKLSYEKKTILSSEHYPQKRKKRCAEITSIQNGITVSTIEDISSIESQSACLPLQHDESSDTQSTVLNSIHIQESPVRVHQLNGSLKSKIISPSYIKTALSERSKRISMTDISSNSSSSFNIDNANRAFSVDVSTERQVINKLNGIKPNSKLNRSLSLNGEKTLVEKKDKKSSGSLKKIFKKVF